MSGLEFLVFHRNPREVVLVTQSHQSQESRVRILAVMFVSLVLVSAGCQRGPALPTPVQIAGKITLKGKPVDSASISFTAISAGLPSKYRYVQGKTDANGEYSIPKVYPAEYLVQINKSDPAAATAAPVAPEQAVANPFENSPFAPYGNESPLRALVQPDATRFDFELAPKK